MQLTRLLCPWNSPGKNTGVGSHSLLQGNFPTQGSNLGLPPCRWILYQLSYYSSKDYTFWRKVKHFPLIWNQGDHQILLISLLNKLYPITCLWFIYDGSVGKESTCNAWETEKMQVQSLDQEAPSPGEGNGTPLQYSCWESHRQRSLAGYSPWGLESDMT